MPHFVETLAEDCGTDGDETFCAWAAPTHASTTKAAFVLFGGTLNHAAANRVSFHTHLEIIHTVQIILEVSSLFKNCFDFVRFGGCMSFECLDQFAYVTLIQFGFPLPIPATILGSYFTVDAASRFSQVLGGMIPIDDLMAGIEVFTNQVPDPITRDRWMPYLSAMSAVRCVSTSTGFVATSMIESRAYSIT